MPGSSLCYCRTTVGLRLCLKKRHHPPSSYFSAPLVGKQTGVGQPIQAEGALPPRHVWALAVLVSSKWTKQLWVDRQRRMISRLGMFITGINKDLLSAGTGST